LIHDIIVSRNKEVRIISEKSRAEYFRKRRESRGKFYVEVEKERLDKLFAKLEDENKTKTEWFNEKLDEEIGAKKE
jgi:hypothetical protein